MGLTKKKSEGNESPNTEDEARSASQAIVRKFALEAAWPSANDDRVKNLLSQMSTEIAALFGRTIDDVSIEDIARAQSKIESVCKKAGIHKIRFGKVRTAVDIYNSASQALDFASHAYWIGNLFVGNFGPAIRKLGLKVGGIPLARVAGVWLAGQAIIELYWDPNGFQKKVKSPKQYHPLFDAFTLEQYREIAVLMGIDAKVAWNEEKLQQEILSLITSSHHNKVTALWSDAPVYQSVLLNLCEELEVPGYKATDSEEVLEERIVQRVLAESIKKMTPEQLKKFESAVKANVKDNYLRGSVTSTMFAGGLVAGKMTGFGLYVAASSALAALGEGLGLTFAFTTYTTMSSALSVVFGPIGISFAAAAAALHWSKARPKKALPFVLYMASARGHLQSQSNQKLGISDRIKRWFKRLFTR